MGSDVRGAVVVRSPIRALVDFRASLQPCIRHGSMHRTPSVFPLVWSAPVYADTLSTTGAICHQALSCLKSGYDSTACDARAFSVSLGLALPLLESCACGLDAGGGRGTTSASGPWESHALE
jgi:hypothetical protein